MEKLEDHDDYISVSLLFGVIFCFNKCALYILK
jgi:hypothetical protein